MDNEQLQLHTIIADVVQARFRSLENRDRVDPMTFGRIVAEEVIRRLETADVVVVSRWTR